jgi:DNA-binding HxlR family transcriptional regulator
MHYESVIGAHWLALPDRLPRMSSTAVEGISGPPPRPPAIDVLTVNAVLIAVRQAANVLCDRWSLVTLLLAHAGMQRFNDFSTHGGMASRLLASRLAMLEAQQIIGRRPYSTRPLRYDYLLSDMGLALFDVFATMTRWEQRWYPAGSGAADAGRCWIDHLDCGATAVHPVPHCADCSAVLDARDIELQVSQRRIRTVPTKQMSFRRSTLSAAHRGLAVPVPLAHAIDVFGDKWGIELVMCLFNRVRRFSDLQLHLGISTNILSDRLSRLASLGILQPTSAIDSTGSGGYALTAKGIDLHPILLAIQAWADAWLRERHRSPVQLVHRLCGQPLQLRVGCDCCGSALCREHSRFRLGQR